MTASASEASSASSKAKRTESGRAMTAEASLLPGVELAELARPRARASRASTALLVRTRSAIDRVSTLPVVTSSVNLTEATGTVGGRIRGRRRLRGGNARREVAAARRVPGEGLLHDGGTRS